MKKLIYLFVGVAFLVSSCTVTQRSTPGASLNVQVNFDMGDLDYIGEVSGTAEQHYLFGLPYGGRKYYTGVIGNGFVGESQVFAFTPTSDVYIYDKNKLINQACSYHFFLLLCQ